MNKYENLFEKSRSSEKAMASVEKISEMNPYRRMINGEYNFILNIIEKEKNEETEKTLKIASERLHLNKTI